MEEPCLILFTLAEAEAEGETQNSGSRGPGENLLSRKQRPHGPPTAEAEAEGQTQISGSGSCRESGRADLSKDPSLPEVFQSTLFDGHLLEFAKNSAFTGFAKCCLWAICRGASIQAGTRHSNAFRNRRAWLGNYTAYHSFYVGMQHGVIFRTCVAFYVREPCPLALPSMTPPPPEVFTQNACMGAKFCAVAISQHCHLFPNDEVCTPQHLYNFERAFHHIQHRQGKSQRYEQRRAANRFRWAQEMGAQQKFHCFESWCGHGRKKVGHHQDVSISTPAAAVPCSILVTPADAETEGEV